MTLLAIKFYYTVVLLWLNTFKIGKVLKHSKGQNMKPNCRNTAMKMYDKGKTQDSSTVIL